MSGDPYSKEAQLARGERRYRRKVASPKEWQRLRAAKLGPCRVCVNVRANGHDYGQVQLHHLVARIHGGDDVEDNLVPVHEFCHGRITRRDKEALKAVADSLSDFERGYVLRKVGEAGYSRIFGVGSGA